MLTRIHRNLHDERGIAIVVALLVTVVVTLLSIAVIAQSIHDLDASGYDRRRLLSVNAAEAGTNAWYAYIQTTDIEDYDCDPLAQTIQTAPSSASFSAAATFYGADGTTEMTCPFSTASYPSYARILSTGTVNGVERQVQTYVSLTPVYGANAAILSATGLSFDNSFTVYGDEGDDADVYVLSGNLVTNNAVTINGNVYVSAGSAHMNNEGHIKGSLWARDSITLDGDSGANPQVDGSAMSSEAGIAGAGSGGSIGGDATAFDTVDESLLSIGGSVFSGTSVGPVPTQSFPQITSSTGAWTSAGYSLVSFSGATACTDAYNWIKGTGAGTWATSGLTNVVVRVSTTCTMTNGNNDSINVRGNLAILSDGGFNWKQRNTWSSTGSIKNVYFISTYAATCSGTGKNITVSNNSTFDPATLKVLFYTPCTATMGNQNAFEGQVLAGNVSLSNLFKLNFEQVLVPGITEITGFKQDIAYVAEV